MVFCPPQKQPCWYVLNDHGSKIASSARHTLPSARTSFAHEAGALRSSLGNDHFKQATWVRLPCTAPAALVPLPQTQTDASSYLPPAFFSGGF